MNSFRFSLFLLIGQKKKLFHPVFFCSGESMYYDSTVYSFLKGIVQRKLRWVENDINRQVLLYYGVGALGIVFY